MTQNLGSTSNPLSMTGEQWVLEERTDDPLSPEPGECWIRTDLNAGDKIATLKFGDGSEVPIFPTGTSETGVLEVRRVQTGGQTGYLPVAEPDESRFPQFRLQHNNTVYSLHDDIEPGVIPDSVEFQHDAGTFSTNDPTWFDDIANHDMEMVDGLQATTLSDGSPAVERDGSGHGLLTFPSSLESSGLESFSVEFVLEYTNPGSTHICGINNSGFDQDLFVRANEEGEASLRMDDDSGATLEFETISANLDDGQRHDVSYIVHDATTNDVEIIVDGSTQSLNMIWSQGPSNFVPWDYDVAFWARNNNGDIDGHFNGKIGLNRWHTSSIKEQTIGTWP